MVELLVVLQPELYRKYVITSKNGEPMLDVKLLKALYGLLRSALLFYNKLAGDLVDMGFEINPSVGGKQGGKWVPNDCYLACGRFKGVP